MFILTLGLQDNQDKGPMWDEDSCYDLTNRLGKEMEQIGELENSQKTDAFRGAQSGGFIRWHILSYGQKIISSTYRNSCVDTFFASVTFKDCPGTTPTTLKRTALRKLVRDLGSNLEQLRGLHRYQATAVWNGLEEAGFVQYAGLQEVALDSLPVEIVPSTTIAQPTAQSQPPMVPHPPMNDFQLFDLDHPSQTFFDDGCPSSEGDWPLDPTQTAGENTGCMPAIAADTPLSSLGVTSPAETTSAPGNGNTSSYPTPSTMVFDPPYMEENAFLCDQPAKRKRLASERPGRKKAKPLVTKPSDTIVHLLQSCAFYQENKADERLRLNLRAESFLFMENPCEILQPLLSDWNDNMLHNVQALGLPAAWKGIEGAANYIRTLEANVTDPFLDPVAERIAEVLLYFNYVELCKCPEKHCPNSKQKPNKTSVLDCILDAYPDNPRQSEPRQSRRNRITTFYVRRGSQWWMLAGTLGTGILLAASSSLWCLMCNETFSVRQIDALATFALNTRPGAVRIFHALEPVVKSLMFGQGLGDLQAILDNEFSLLGQHELARAYTEDEAALARQRIENPWTEVNTKECAMKKMHEFLADVDVLAT